MDFDTTLGKEDQANQSQYKVQLTSVEVFGGYNKENELKIESEDELPEHPFGLLKKWFLAPCMMRDIKTEKNPIHMCTLREDDAFAERFIIIKGFDERGFVFYTRRKDKLGKEIDPNDNAEMVFNWEINWDGGLIYNSIKVFGNLVKSTKEQIEHFFETMQPDSLNSYWTSKNSETIDDEDLAIKRELLADDYDEFREEIMN